MKCALINPNWSFEGSVYFGCRAPHLPLEYGYAKALLESQGHEAVILDAHGEQWSHAELRDRLARFQPDISVLTTAPNYLFWRCAPPELRVPQETARAIRERAGMILLVGPHPSVTPETALRKVGAEVALLGEFEDLLPELLSLPQSAWAQLPSVHVRGGPAAGKRPHAADVAALPALVWPQAALDRHTHHHHRFDRLPTGRGAEIEASRGCPYQCSFCAKEVFRNRYRRRPMDRVIAELDGLIAAGVQYVYFIDEIFQPHRELLEALTTRPVEFGVQLRIDLWNNEELELLGRAGCVSIEAGVESVSDAGRKRLGKRCALPMEAMAERLAFAKRHIPFVQANLIASELDSPEDVERWREALLARGVWANQPVPLFAYPGSALYRELWGEPDEQAWERAHAHYLQRTGGFSDIQEQQPLPLFELEGAHA